MLSKYTNLFFPVCSLVVSITIFIAFFSKKKLNSKETTIYSQLVVIGLCESLLYTIICLIAHFISVNDNFVLYVFLNKALYAIYIIWFTILFRYINNINFVFKTNSLFNKITDRVIVIVDVILIFLIAILKVEIYFDFKTGLSNSYGPSSNILFIGIGFYIIMMGIKAFSNLAIRYQKKYIPLYLLLFLMVVALFIRAFDPLFSIYSNVLSLVVLVMYFTIENPDLKILEEYNKNKELVEIGIEEKSNMLFKISEEVRTPIKKIKLINNNVLNSNNIKEIHESAREIDIIATNTGNFVDEVLDISTLDKQKIKMVNSSYNIYNLFSQIIYIIKSRIDNKIDFKYSISNIIPEKLYGDGLRLKQIICSILLNAFKHTEKGIVDLDISAIIKYDICRLIINISDTGKGLSLTKINEILESNVNITEQEFGKIDNLDVNLKFIKKMIAIFGGSLLIKSEDGKGTTFTVILNQLIDVRCNDTKIDSLAKVLTNKKRVLLVDDNYQELKKLSSELKRNNYNVVTTMYGKDCIDKINNNEKFDLIFIDDEMEDYNAVKTIKSLSKEKIENVNIIVMLNKDKNIIKEHYLEDYAFTDYLLKDNYKEEIKRIKEKY